MPGGRPPDRSFSSEGGLTQRTACASRLGTPYVCHAVGRLVLTALVVSLAIPAAAQARFSAPQEVAAAGAFHRGFVAAADASGRLTVATRAADDPPRLTNAPRLIERPPGGGWADLPPVHGIAPRSYIYKTAISAAGDGALGLAWVISGHRTNSIQVAVREPRGTLSDPIEIAGTAANGVNHAAIAVDADGDVLVAYETGTGASHTGDQGQIAVAYRPAGHSSFIGPVVVDRVLSNPPVVALAQDGTGIVTWTRRQTLMAATIGANGAVGAASRIARQVLGDRPVVAAGPRSAASVAYRVNETAVHGKHGSVRYSLRMLARPAGGTFGRAQTVFRGSSINRGVALVADEQGRATLAWAGAASRATGSRIWTAAGRAGRPFGHPRMVARGDQSFDEPFSVAARNGHVGLAWRQLTAGAPTGVQVGAGDWNEALDPELISSAPPAERPAMTVAGDGRTSAIWRAGKLWASYGP